MRRFIALAAVLAVALAFASTAAADQPIIFEQSFAVTTPSPNFSCVPYGYGFTVLATFEGERRHIQFFDEGVLVKEIRHVRFEGTLYKSTDLSKTIPYAGAFTRTFDVDARTITFTGLFRYSRTDRSGMLAVDAGRTVVSTAVLPPPPPLFDAGPAGADYEAAVCAYLAAA